MLKRIWNFKKSYKKCQNYVKNEEIDFSFLVPQFLVRNFSYGNSSIFRFSRGTTTCSHHTYLIDFHFTYFPNSKKLKAFDHDDDFFFAFLLVFTTRVS